MKKISNFIEINVDISSSNIRDSILSGNEENINYYIPDELINDLDDFKKTIK